LRFRDVQVYAPQIELYAPFIHWIIDFPHLIYDIPEQSHLFERLYLLVDNPEKWENFLLLFSLDAFLSKQKIAIAEVEKWKEISEKIHILRGFGEKSYPISVENGLKRWILAFVQLEEDSLELDMTECK